MAMERSQTEASISTVPGAFRSEVRSDSERAAIARVSSITRPTLKRLHQETGVRITLAIEPEPACVMETVDETIAFFQGSLWSRANVDAAARVAGIDLSAEDVATYLGICLDTCHMAVEFEDVDGAFQRLDAAGIGIYKVQLSSALRLQRGEHSPSPQSLLGRFADDTYLHQVRDLG
jgi:sugar phosphate isomerase/epimerase